MGQPDRLPFSPFSIRRDNRRDYFPRNVYPKDYKRLEAHVRPLMTYLAEVRDGDVWVDLE